MSVQRKPVYDGSHKKLEWMYQTPDNDWHHRVYAASEGFTGFEVGDQDDESKYFGMYYDQTNEKLGFGRARRATNFPLEISSTGVVSIYGSGSADAEMAVGPSAGAYDTVMTIDANGNGNDGFLRFANDGTDRFDIRLETSGGGGSEVLDFRQGANVIAQMRPSLSALRCDGGIAGPSGGTSATANGTENVAYTNSPTCGFIDIDATATNNIAVTGTAGTDTDDVYIWSVDNTTDIAQLGLTSVIAGGFTISVGSMTTQTRFYWQLARSFSHVNVAPA